MYVPTADDIGHSLKIECYVFTEANNGYESIGAAGELLVGPVQVGYGGYDYNQIPLIYSMLKSLIYIIGFH